MPEIIITHAPEAAARAERVARKLEGLGFTIFEDFDASGASSPFARRKRAAAIDAAAGVVVLWSKDAAAAPALFEAASRAKARGKLALARLDSAAPPASLKGAIDLSSWMGRDTPRWRALVAALGPATPAVSRRGAAAPARAVSAAPAEKKKGGGGLIAAFVTLLVLGAIGAGGYYAYLNHLIPGL